MLFRLSADQTERLFILISLDSRALTSSLSFCFSFCLFRLFRLFLSLFPFDLYLHRLSYSKCNCQDPGGIACCNLGLRTCTFCRRCPILASTLHNTSTFSKCLSPPPVMYFFPFVLRITCFSFSAKYPCARIAALLRAFFPGPLYVCFDSSYNLLLFSLL